MDQQMHHSFRNNRVLWLIGWCCFGFFVLGMIFPESWWGIHFLAFLSPITKGVLLVLAFALMWSGTFLKKIPKQLEIPNPIGRWLPLILSVSAGIIFMAFPIHSEVYGDATRWIKGLQGPSDLSNAAHWRLLLDPNVFQAKIGERTMLNAVWLLSQGAGISIEKAFAWIGAVSGALWVFFGLHFIRIYINNRLGQVVFALVLLTTPIGQNFFGHAEIYAPGLLFISGFMMCMLLYLHTRKRMYLLAMLPLLFLAMKLHASGVLLCPAMGMCAFHYFRNISGRKRPFLGWKKAFLFLVVPALAVGAFVYFFVLKDHVDPRFLESDISVINRLFLPIFSPEAPLDRYNLFSLNHLLDYFNMILMWSTGALFLVLVWGMEKRKEIDWNDPGIVVTAVTFIFYFLFFFMVNPLLGMPQDWDLFSLPGVAFIFFAMAMGRELEMKEQFWKYTGVVAGLGILSLAYIPVNHHPDSLSHRTESLGRHTFKTYWAHAADMLFNSLNILENNPELRWQRSVQLADDLEPFAVVGNDIIYAQLARDAGLGLLQNGAEEKAVRYYEKVLRYHPKNGLYLLELMEAYFVLKQFDEAYKISLQMIVKNRPDPAKAQLIAMHCALEAKYVKAVRLHLGAYLQLVPDDARIREVDRVLQESGNVEEALRRFTRP